MYVGNMYVMVDKLETGVPNEQSWVGPYGNFTKVGNFEFRGIVNSNWQVRMLKCC